MSGCGGRIFRKFSGDANGCAWDLRIETMEDGEEIGGTEGKTDAGDVFLCDFEGVKANDLAAGVEKRAAGIAGVNGGIGLNPGAGAEGGKFSDGTDDSFCSAEKHGVTRITNGKDGFALLDGGDVGQNEVGKSVVGRRRIGFDEGDVEVGINVDDTGLQLDIVWKQGEERRIAAGDVGIGCNDAGCGDEEARAHGAEAFEADDGGLGALDDFFEGEIELKGGWLRGGDGGYRAGEGGGDELEIGMEVIGFDEPVFAVIVAVEVDPVHWADSEGDFAGGVARKGKTGDHGMFEALAKCGVSTMKVAAGKICFEGGGAEGDAIDLDGCAGRSAGDFERFSGRGSNEAKK